MNKKRELNCQILREVFNKAVYIILILLIIVPNGLLESQVKIQRKIVFPVEPIKDGYLFLELSILNIIVL